MELVMQGIGGGIVGLALIRIPLVLLALWRQAGYKQEHGRRSLNVFRHPVQAAKARHRKRKGQDSTVTASFPGIQVVFAKSGKTCTWDPSIGSLLKLAKRNRIKVRFGCRAGKCGGCFTTIKSGTVSHVAPLEDPPPAGSCLMCLAIPTGNLILDA